MRVFLIISALILIILIIPIKLRIRFAYSESETDGEIYLKFLFFRFDIFPKKEKEKVEEEAKADEKEIKKDAEKGKIFKIFSLVKNIYRDVLNALNKILSFIDTHQIAVEHVNISAKLATGDAALTGIATGGANAFVYNIVGWISRHTKLGDYNVSIIPDFGYEARIAAGADVLLRSSLIYILALCVILVKEALKILIKIRKLNKAERTDTHESTAGYNQHDNG